MYRDSLTGPIKPFKPILKYGGIHILKVYGVILGLTENAGVDYNVVHIPLTHIANKIPSIFNLK